MPLRVYTAVRVFDTHVLTHQVRAQVRFRFDSRVAQLGNGSFHFLLPDAICQQPPSTIHIPIANRCESALLRVGAAPCRARTRHRGLLVCDRVYDYDDDDDEEEEDADDDDAEKEYEEDDAENEDEDEDEDENGDEDKDKEEDEEEEEEEDEDEDEDE